MKWPPSHPHNEWMYYSKECAIAGQKGYKDRNVDKG